MSWWHTLSKLLYSEPLDSMPLDSKPQDSKPQDSKPQDERTAACAAITALGSASPDDALDDWYGVELPIGHTRTSWKSSERTHFTVVIEDIRPTPLLRDPPSKFFALNQRICFPIGTVFQNERTFAKSERTEYILVKDVSNDIYWIMVDGITWKYSESPWYKIKVTISQLGPLSFACARLRSAWPTNDVHEVDLSLFPCFRVDGVKRNNNSLLEPGLLEDEFDEDEYHRLASEHRDEIWELVDRTVRVDDELIAPLMQLLGLTTRADACRFIHRHRHGLCWRGPVTAKALFHEAFLLSTKHATFYGIDLFKHRALVAPDIRITLKRGRQEPYRMTLSQGGIAGFAIGDCDDEEEDIALARRNCYGTIRVEAPPPPAFDGSTLPWDSLVTIKLINDESGPRIIMPLGLLRFNDEPTCFFLARDLSRDAKSYIVLYNPEHETIYENDIDYPEVTPSNWRYANIKESEESFTAMEVELTEVTQKDSVVLTVKKAGVHRRGYRRAPMGLVQNKLIHPWDLPYVAGQAMWSTDRWIVDLV